MELDDLDEERRWEQYGRAVEEYRFQVDLNWRRSQYYFVLTAAVIAVAGALYTSSTPVPKGVVALLFAAGTVIAVLAILANHTARGYYKETRDLKGRLEALLLPDELAVRTTEGMGSRLSRLGRVTTFQTVMLVTLALASATGAALAAFGVGHRAQRSSPVLVTLVARASMVVSQGQLVPARAVILARSRHSPVRLRPLGRGYFFGDVEPGVYSVVVLAGRSCNTHVSVTSAPVQRRRALCRAN